MEKEIITPLIPNPPPLDPQNQATCNYYYPPPPPALHAWTGQSRYIPPPAPQNHGEQNLIPGISKSTVRGSNDKLIIAAVVMTAITLIITGLFWFLCVLPNIFWIYKASVTNDQKEKAKYSKFACGGSLVCFICSGIAASLVFAVFVASYVINNLNSSSTTTTDY